MSMIRDPFEIPVPACPASVPRAAREAAAECPLFSAAAPFDPHPALERVLAERLRQVHDFGHTPEADGEVAIEKFAPILREAAKDAAEYLSLHRYDDVTLRKLGKLGAWVLATIDRVALEQRRTALTGETL